MVEPKFRTIKPSDLDNHIGEHFTVLLHAGNSSYDRWSGVLAGGTNEYSEFGNKTPRGRKEGAEFYLKNVSFDDSRLSAGWRFPIKHGDLMVSHRESEDYIFLDESD